MVKTIRRLSRLAPPNAEQMVKIKTNNLMEDKIWREIGVSYKVDMNVFIRHF